MDIKKNHQRYIDLISSSSDHMNRIPLAVFLLEEKDGIIWHICIFIFIIILYFDVSGLRLFDPLEDTGNAGTALAQPGKL